MSFDNQTIRFFVNGQIMGRPIGDHPMQADGKRLGHGRWWAVLSQPAPHHHFIEPFKPTQSTQTSLIDKRWIHRPILNRRVPADWETVHPRLPKAHSASRDNRNMESAVAQFQQLNTLTTASMKGVQSGSDSTNRLHRGMIRRDILGHIGQDNCGHGDQTYRDKVGRCSGMTGT